MLNAETAARLGAVKAATVHFPGNGGRGVLVVGELVLTATHCIEWDYGPGLTLGDYHPMVANAGGSRFRLQPYFADAVSDMAALGEMDNQELPDDADAFEAWRERVEPVKLSSWIPQARNIESPEDPPEQLDVYLLSLKGEWEPGRVVHYGFSSPTSRVCIHSQKALEGGMSGGPVVDVLGALVGVVSCGSETGQIPLARLALPGWIINRVDPVG